MRIINEFVYSAKRRFSIRKTVSCFVLSVFFANSVSVPVIYADPVVLQPNEAGYIFLDEDFESAQDGDVIASDTWCMEGWSFYKGTSTALSLDSEFTVITDPNDSENMIGKAYRSVANADSLEAAMEYAFEGDNAIQGGEVELQMRINRDDQRMREWDLLLYNTESSKDPVNVRVYLHQSKLIVGDYNGYFFDEATGTRLTANTKYATDTWLTVKMTINLVDNTFSFYQGDYCVAENEDLPDVLNGKIDKIRLRSARNMSANSATTLYVDDIKLTRTGAALSDGELLARAKDELILWMEENLSAPLESNVALPGKTGAADVVWRSSDEAVISPEGAINRKWQEEQRATLYADLSYKGLEEHLEMEVVIAAITETVPPTQALLEGAAEEFPFSAISGDSPYGIFNPLNLIEEYNLGASALFGGMNISWSASPEGIIAADGTLAKAQQVQNAELTASFTAKDDETVSAQKTFSVTVLPAGDNFLYETFEEDSTPRREINGWNGWSEVNSSKATYIDDTEITLEKEEDTQNMFLQIFRPTVNSDSAQVTAAKALEKKDGGEAIPAPLAGGEANIRFRLKRNNDAKVLWINLDDANGYRETIRVNFNSSGLRPSGNAVFQDKIPFGTVPANGVWLQAELTINYDKNIFSLSFYDEVNDHMELFENLPMGNNAGNLASISFGTERSGTNKGGMKFFIDDLFITQSKEKISDSDAAEIVADEILNDFNNITASEDLELSSKGDYKSMIIWSSSNEDVIKIINGYGIVTPGDSSEDVQLTASVIRGNVKAVRTMTVTVPAFSGTTAPTQELFEKAVARYSFGEVTDEDMNMITSDLALPSEYNKGYGKRIGGIEISWTSSHPYVITDEGKITKQKYDTFVTLTANFRAKENSALTLSREFKICIAAEGELVFSENFQEADFERDMYKSMDETGVVSAGQKQKTVYKNWILHADSDSKKVNTDTQVTYFPADPYETVLNYTREQNNNTAEVPVTFTYTEFGKEYGSGVLYMSLRFYLTGNSSRITVGPLIKTQTIGSNNINCRYNRIADVVRDVPNNRWHYLTYALYLSGDAGTPHRFDVFLDGERVNTDQRVTTTGNAVYGMQISSIRTSDGPNSNWYVDDITVRHVASGGENPSDQAVLNTEINIPASVTDNISLPVYGEDGTRIVWSSSDKDVISESGKVYHSNQDGSSSATLTATITKGSSFTTKTFPVSISAPADAKPYEVSSIVRSGNSISGVSVLNRSFGGNCVLITTLRSRGKVMDMRVSDLSASVGGGESVVFNKAIDTSPYLSYEIQSYVYDTDSNKIISRLYREEADR